MRPIAVLVSVVTLIVALVAVAWIGQGPTSQDPAAPPPPKAAADKPQPRIVGPHPKCIALDPTYDFGSMAHRSKGSHKFVVKNEGKVPLKLQTGQTTCQCTIGKLGDDTVPPGGETTIELNWEIRAKSPKFQHQATIHTDDPEKLQFDLIVKGLVTFDLINTPNDLSFGNMHEDRPSVGYVYVSSTNSADFTITKIETSSPEVTATFVEIPEAERQDFYQSYMTQNDYPPELKNDFSKLVKKVFRVDVKAVGQKRQGSFKESVSVHTDVKDSEPIRIPITGENPGALQFFPQGGARWYPRNMTLDLGEFSGEVGRKRSLNVIARECKEPLEFVIESVVPAVVKVTATRDPNNKSACKLEFEVPAGTPSLIKTPDEPATVVIKSNHPHAEKLELNVIFSVQ